MAKTVGPLFSQEAHGTIAEHLTFSKRKTCKQVRFQKKQIDVITDARTTHRAIFLDAVAAWNLLSAGEKAAYNTSAVPLRITGYNLFIREYIANPILPVELDYMEYANDAAAQAAYPTNAVAGNDSYAKLLVPCNGADTSTTIPDTSVGGGHGNATVNGNAQIDTDIVGPFGGNTGILLLDGTDDWISWINSADWGLANGNWTIDWRQRFNVLGITAYFCGQFLNGTNRWHINIDGSNRIVSYSYIGGVVYDNYQSVAPGFVVDTWYHIAVVRSGSTCYIFINGVSKSVTELEPFAERPAINAPFCIGDYDRLGNGEVNGQIKEFRLSKGIARWTANFTPPAFQYDTAFSLQDFSENTIKTQGSYSLKGVATL